MKSTNEVEKSIDGDHEGKVEDDESDVKRVSSSQFASGKWKIVDKKVESVIKIFETKIFVNKRIENLHRKFAPKIRLFRS